MASQVEIVNLALSKLGEQRITSMSDNSKPARAALARFDHLRDAELEGYSWRFAVKRTTLPALTETPPWGYAYMYERPVDDLRVLRLGDTYVDVRAIGVMYESSGYQRSAAAYEVIEGKIHTDLAAPLKYEYISKVTETGQFTELFVQALACRLAADMAEELTQSNSKVEAARQEYKMVMSEARRINALYSPPRTRAMGNWMMSRAW